MGVFYETVPESMGAWVREQKMFWVATAPLSGRGHVNLSPKGGEGCFGLVDDRTFWYLDLSGSGIETVSHLGEPGNGRVTVMLNAFEGPPKIVRLWGKGRVLENKTPEFAAFVSKHGVEILPGTRSIVVVDIHQVGSSCGFSVPYFDFRGHRPILNDLWEKKEAKWKADDEKEGLEKYWAFKNAWSMDQLPGMKSGVEIGRRDKIEPIKKMVGPLAPQRYYDDTSSGSKTFVLLVALISFVLGVSLALYGPALLQASVEQGRRYGMGDGPAGEYYNLVADAVQSGVREQGS